MDIWLEESGAAGLDGLEIADFPVTGRGVKARRAYKNGEKILTIPSSMLWTVEKAYDDPLLGPALRAVKPSLSDEDILAIYILFVRSRDSGYEGPKEHIAVLPDSYSSSVFFTDEELEVCAGTSVYALTRQLKQRVLEDYKSLMVRLFARHQDLFPLPKFSIHDYKWALCTIWSRAMDFAVSEAKSIRLVAPFADMLNHSLEAKQCHAYDPSSGDLSIFANKDYQVGDQIYISYGPVPNSRLLRLYGFIIPGNPNDSYDLVLQTNPAAPLYEQKEGLWSLAGLEPTCTVPLTLADPLPRQVLQYLRIQRLEEPDLPAMTLQLARGSDEKVNDGNERQILEFLIQSIGSILDSFGIAVEKLEVQLADGVYSPGGNAWAAAQVSLSEQRILKLTRKRAEDLLEGLNSDSLPSPSVASCANCGNSTGRLMLCSRCKAVKYCGRECQVAHFGEHKALCRSIAKHDAKS